MGIIHHDTIDLDIKNVLEHIFLEKTLNPGNPIAKNYVPYFQFEFGPEPLTHEPNVARVIAWPDGQNDINTDLGEIERSYFIRFRVIAAHDDEKSEDLFYTFFGRFKSNFGGTALNHEYQNPIKYKDKDRLQKVLNAPFKLGATGVHSTDIISTFGPRRMEAEHCRPLYVEMLVRWRFYLSVC